MEKQDVALSLFDPSGETTEKIIDNKAGYQRARERQIALMRKGLDLGAAGKNLLTREELHARR
ncbi:MAG: hypothetical protein HQL03_14650 [Nitrospirae bacterium]|nr:hypothetical protein [Nitrospirota bacterium]MBF0592233.1 hypothetical protein [Nitrospirota bacterium]